MKIAIAGTGYVGLSLAVLLSLKHDVIAYDIVPDKIKLINQKESPIEDAEIKEYLKKQPLHLTATLDYQTAFKEADYIIISTPTNYDDSTGKFDTTSIEDVIEKAISVNQSATIIIKSTIPVGYTRLIKEKFNYKNIYFSPEFLREGKALYDNLYPSRIIIGDDSPSARRFGQILKTCAKNKPSLLFMNSTEAEAVKLFSNTYLALRIAYFNELDTYAEIKGLKTEDIIKGVSLDPRIGDFYNNPSFGYGGYCLPKDTKQLLANYQNISQNLIEAIVKANQTRKQHIAKAILKNNPKTIGIYRLTMKTNSDNFRSSAIRDIISILKKQPVNIIIYEPTITTKMFEGCQVINDLDAFSIQSDIILANRYDNNLAKYRNKVYTRDIFGRD